MPFTERQRKALMYKMKDLNPIVAEEWISFLEQLDLNPFLGEAVVLGNGIYVTNKGLLKLLQRSGRYDGHEYEWGMDKDGKLIYVDVKLYLKDLSHPVIERAWLRDYNHLIQRQRGSMAWKTSPYDMLAVKAMNKAIRRGLGLNVTSAEEVLDEDAIRDVVKTLLKEESTMEVEEPQQEDFYVLLMRWLSQLPNDKDKVKEAYREAMKELGISKIETQDQYDKLVASILAKLAE